MGPVGDPAIPTCLARANFPWLVLFLGLSACTPTASSRDEVARVVAPDGRTDAVLIEVNGGATTTYVYDVVLVPHNAAPATRPRLVVEGATRNAGAFGVDLRWRSSDELDVEYLAARSTRAPDDGASAGTAAIRVVPRSGVTNPTAPPGGMAYNRARP